MLKSIYRTNLKVRSEAIDIVKNINNNISEHFIDYVNKFVNVSFNIKEKIKDITKNKDLTDIEKKQQKKEIYDKHRLIKKIFLDLIINQTVIKNFMIGLKIINRILLRKSKNIKIKKKNS